MYENAIIKPMNKWNYIWWGDNIDWWKCEGGDGPKEKKEGWII